MKRVWSRGVSPSRFEGLRAETVLFLAPSERRASERRFLIRLSHLSILSHRSIVPFDDSRRDSGCPNPGVPIRFCQFARSVGESGCPNSLFLSQFPFSVWDSVWDCLGLGVGQPELARRWTAGNRGPIFLRGFVAKKRCPYRAARTRLLIRSHVARAFFGCFGRVRVGVDRRTAAANRCG